jgi:flavin reductase (DIM6/NTAB) family NADH-FMN oxidoreductase RutF
LAVWSGRGISASALRDTWECVLAVPAADLAETVADIGNCTGADTDKFRTFGLMPLSAAKVKAPLVKECLQP